VTDHVVHLIILVGISRDYVSMTGLRIYIGDLRASVFCETLPSVNKWIGGLEGARREAGSNENWRF
jgi:hypothetical protein